jgi:transposase
LRPGAAYFLEPDSSQQRRYEALRAYFVDDLPASQVADRYGYSTASVHQMATLLRSGRLRLFAQTKPGPKGPRKATGELRTTVLRLRAADHSVTEIAQALTAQGLPVSAQTVWQVLQAEGLPRLGRRDEGRRGSPARLDPVKAIKLTAWPAAAQLPCDHAGLLLLVPAMADLGLHELIRKAGYPSTTALSAWQSIASLLLAKCARRPRIHHLGSLTDDAGLAFALGLSALPKATHLGSYSYRVRRQSNQQLLTGLVGALRPLGLATGEAGFNLDFHAIRHHGDDTVLERHYVPRRSQRTRAVLTFFAQDHTSAEMVYANADITKAEQAREIIAFADYWQQATGADPGLLVFDSQLTTYQVLDELTSRRIRWLTLRQRGTRELARLAALPASAWKPARLDRAGRYRHPRLHEDQVRLKGIHTTVRQIAIQNIGRDQPTLLITNDQASPAVDLFGRYAERMLIENELDAYIAGFHLDALTSSIPLNVDLDTTLTVIAGNLYRLLARQLPRYQTATPDKLWRHFLDTGGTLHITDDQVTCALNLRSYHPVLIDGGFADLDVPIPWWQGRTLRFRFPPR